MSLTLYEVKFFYSSFQPINNFHQLEVLDLGSETQLHVGENLNCIT